MTNPPKNHDELIFAYLDGDLDPQQLADFKAILESDPAIQSRLDALNAMNTSLIRIAQEPTSAPLVLEPKQTTKTSPRRWISYAAILAITTALFLYMNPSQPKAVFDTQNVYRQITTAFEPQIVCDSPEKFVAYTQESFGKPITVDFQTPIQLVGWRYLGKNYNPGRPTKVPSWRKPQKAPASSSRSSRADSPHPKRNRDQTYMCSRNPCNRSGSTRSPRSIPRACWTS